MDNLIN